MPVTHSEFGRAVRNLHDALRELSIAAETLNIAPLAGREWFELLQDKLIPQLTDDAFLVLAVVGGTNIGKSVIFNHLAGTRASSTSPLASGTKHPVCLVPAGFTDRHNLAEIFPGFHLEQWSHSDVALESRDEHTLFWRDSDVTADNLLVLDTPDIDSDAAVNWVRADAVRRCADVLIAVLTQQKYNDAAVKQFFRHAAEEDKAVVVVFNQCLLPEDEEYWPVWLNTFCTETGIRPEFVYVAPNDRRAAEDNRLPFFERVWPVDRTGERAERSDSQQSVSATGRADSRSLAEDLSRLRFREIKFRTLRGAMERVVTDPAGVDSYQAEVRARSADFAAAASQFSADGVVRIRDWPPIPNGMLVTEIREWWRARQEGWARRVNEVYDTIGSGVMWPVRALRDQWQGPTEAPLERYRTREWDAVLLSIEEIFDRLTWMAESGSELLKPRLTKLLQGQSRADLIHRLRAEHDHVDLDLELERTVNREMQLFQDDSPDLYRFYRQLNNVSAAVRPVTSVVLFSLGAGPAGDAVAPFVADAAAQAIVPIVAGMAGGATAAVAGEAAVSGAAGQGAGFLQIRFHRLQTTFMESRLDWLLALLRRDLLGDLPEQLQEAATLTDSTAFQNVERRAQTVRRLLQQSTSPAARQKTAS